MVYAVVHRGRKKASCTLRLLIAECTGMTKCRNVRDINYAMRFADKALRSADSKADSHLGLVALCFKEKHSPCFLQAAEIGHFKPCHAALLFEGPKCRHHFSETLFFQQLFFLRPYRFYRVTARLEYRSP